jgi:DNA adenine methylase
MRDETKARKLKMVLELTPFSRTEFNAAAAALKNDLSDIEKARLTLLRSFAGFGSASTNPEHSTGFRSCSTRSGSTPAHDWMNYPEQIELFTQRLRGVIIENRDYWEVMKIHDAKTTLHYLDPPYVQSTRNLVRKNASYKYEFTDADHREMVERCDQLEGMIIISGYNSTLYNEILGHWQKVEKSTHADGAKDRIECLWLNPACAAAQQQMKMKL